MKYGYRVGNEYVKVNIMPEVYYKKKINKINAVINMVKSTYRVDRVLIILK